MRMQRPFNEIYEQTLAHRRIHDCGTYPFGDGEGLVELVNTRSPNRILELGTALGYTACCFASAANKAIIDTCEMDDAHVRLARENISQHGFAARVKVHHGKFEDTLPSLADGYDIVFFDGFAPDLAVISLAMARLRIGGILICANLRWAEPAMRNQIEKKIQNSSHWKILPALENG